MADILPSQPTVPSLSSSIESAGNLPIDRSKKNLSSHTNKYNGHVTRLRNVFNTDQPVTKQSKSKSSAGSMIDHPLIHEDFSSSPSHRRYSPSEQHYDFPADVLQQLKKTNEGQILLPSLLPSNVFKRMNHLNTTFVKPTKIEGIPSMKKDSESLESPGANGKTK